MEFDVMNVVFDLAVILLATKFFGLVTRHYGFPQVVGMVIAGLLVGPAIVSALPFGIDGIIAPTEAEMNALHAFAQVGACLVLFSSGLETNLTELKKSGVKATLIACGGVLVPLLLGTVGALFFMRFDVSDPHVIYNARFVGCILTATSVGITVETLRELKKLQTPVGTVILSAAIIDDVLGILVLSVVTNLKGGGNIWMTLGRTVGFFVFAVGFGFLFRAIFRWLGKTRPHRRRTSILALSLCFIFAYYAEEYFGVAAITGAYMAGIMLSGLEDTAFVDRKVVVSGYMFFTPIFFAYIGISADFSQFRVGDLWFCLVFVILGIAGKILGCAGVGQACKLPNKESLTIGCGMIARGEVALAVYAAGAALIYTDSNGKLVGIDPLAATIFLILTSSVLCPILLNACFGKKRKKNVKKAAS